MPAPVTSLVLRRIGAYLVVGLVLASFLVALGKTQSASATQIVVSRFTSSTNGITEAEANDWSVSGNTAATNASLPVMADGPDADSDVDRLRLTSTGEGQTGYALYDVAQTTTSGLDITFNMAMHSYGGTGCPANPADNYNSTSTGGVEPNSSTTCQADGFVFYLKNGTNTDTGGSSLGQAGGSLGYSPISSNGSSGLNGALLGVGFDAYGNFYQNPYNGSGCSDPSHSDSQLARRSLIVRGPMGSSRSAGYCRIETTADRTEDSRNIGVDLSSFADMFNSVGVAVRITIDTADTSGSRSNGTGTIYVSTAGTTSWSGVSVLARFELPQALRDASTFKFGFVAGTGGGAMNADIWAATVDSIRDIPDPSISTAGPFCLSTLGNFSQQITGSEGVAPYSYSVQSGSLPPGISLSSSGLISGTPTTSGDYSPTIAISDASTSTGSGSRALTFNVLSTGCDSRIVWTIAGASPTLPESSGDDGSCSTGTYSQSNDGAYRVATFSATSNDDGSCTWSAPAGVTYVEALVVGGGGGGGFDAGGGGGGGGIAYHSAILASSSATITVGSGGAGSTTSWPWSSRTGAAGSTSTLTLGTVTLTADGGSGGQGCNWSGTICTSDGDGNSGGSGGTANGGSFNFAGGAGGNGVWHSAQSSDPADIAQSGESGTLGQTGLTGQTYGCGGGGSGAGLDAGSGGCTNAASGITGGGEPSNATANMGGGGAGGNGGAGSAGGSGTVIIRYTVVQGTNDPAISVEHSITGLQSLDTHGTFKRQFADWDSINGCGSTWTTDSASITTGSDATSLSRSKCYRWTHDNDVASGGVRPTDTVNYSPLVNLTSPVVVLVPEVDVTVPTTFPVDPRVQSMDLAGSRITGSTSVLLCVFQSDVGQLAGAGTPTESSTLTFDVATLGSTQTSAQSTTITGDQTSEVSISGSIANTMNVTDTVRVTKSSAFTESVFVLIRAIPVVSGFDSSCTAGSGGLRPHGSGAGIFEIKPLQLEATYSTAVPVGRQ